jgi:hypothetical protein
MAWQLINPRLYADHLHAVAQVGARSGSEAAVTLWYQDDSPVSPGELVVQLGDGGTLLWFQLSHTKWPHGHERIAEWRADSGLRVGEVSGGDSDGAGHHRDMSPLVHYFAEPDPAVVADLADYFLSHASSLADGVADAVAQAIWQSLPRT